MKDEIFIVGKDGIVYEDFVARGWTCPRQEGHLVVAVQVILVGSVAELHAFQQLVGDVRITGGRHQRGEPGSFLATARTNQNWVTGRMQYPKIEANQMRPATKWLRHARV